MQTALADSLIGEGRSVFDFGCGHGDDVRLLNEIGIRASGWDPAFSPDSVLPSSADVVNLGYVINVIEDEQERADVVCRAWDLSQQLLIVSARLVREVRDQLYADEFCDGRCTRRNTFQKFYEQHELRTWLEDVLGVETVAAAPGIFYVFRSAEALERFNAARFRRRVPRLVVSRATQHFREHEELLAPLMEFVHARGRLPSDEEAGAFVAVSSLFGSLKRAFRVIARATEPGQWERVARERAQDLLVYLALGRFHGRPRRKELPLDIRGDIRAFFGTYKKACSEADALLFSVGNQAILESALDASSIGKLTASALYVHAAALPYLSPVLRLYEGCARVLVGAVPDANIVKLHRYRREISYLAYPDFDTDAHPALRGSLLVNLQSLRVSYRDFRDSTNPPILHRKEQFLLAEDDRRKCFAALTAAEEALGLYEDTKTIGTRSGWQELLRSKNVRITGHDVATSPELPAKS